MASTQYFPNGTPQHVIDTARDAYRRNYMREYMRARRALKKQQETEKTNGSAADTR